MLCRMLCVCASVFEWVYDYVYVCVQCALDIFNLPAIKRQLTIATLMRPKVYNGLAVQTEVRVFYIIHFIVVNTLQK